MLQWYLRGGIGIVEERAATDLTISSQESINVLHILIILTNKGGLYGKRKIY